MMFAPYALRESGRLKDVGASTFRLRRNVSHTAMATSELAVPARNIFIIVKSVNDSCARMMDGIATNPFSNAKPNVRPTGNAPNTVGMDSDMTESLAWTDDGGVCGWGRRGGTTARETLANRHRARTRQ